jgi:lipopolysaccharide transport system ATP-binding protein
MGTVIQVENLSKSYRLGNIGGGTLRADVSRWLAKLRSQTDPNLKIGQEHHARLKGQEFSALQDVSFEVQQGEILGIIGRNGAGKSTLLKILSRVTAPTSGEVRVKGRIASLLEVGTGFHPELTGRENVFLNGAILGMSKAEMRRKFDEIVAFSEVEAFIDTPVKRYSSGMYVRLAFAVAAHLEPEILIVDEVLAVGDTVFQQKCIGKMKDVSEQGRTILFVSHNLNAISTLCSKSLVLKNGRLIFQGKVEDSLGHYGVSTDVSDVIDLIGKKAGAYLQTLSIIQNSQSGPGVLKSNDEVDLVFSIKTNKRLSKARLSVAFTSMKGERVFAVGTWLGPGKLPMLDDACKVTISFIMPPVVPGRYTLDIGFYDSEANIYEEFYSAGAIEIAETNYLKMIDPVVSEIGQLFVRSNFSVNKAF